MDKDYLTRLIEEFEPDGAPLFSTAHPTAPWWRRLFNWIFHRDLNPKSLTTVEIEIADAQEQDQTR